MIIFAFKTIRKSIYYYQYILAVNSDQIDDELRYTLNIVATVLNQKLKERNLSNRQKNLVADLDKAKSLIKSILPEHEYSFHHHHNHQHKEEEQLDEL